MSTGSITIRALTYAEHLLPRKRERSVAKLVEVKAADEETSRETKRPKTVGYCCPEWWESHHYERR
jgi:hypothetical protein